MTVTHKAFRQLVVLMPFLVSGTTIAIAAWAWTHQTASAERKWTTGFWYWSANSPTTRESSSPVDALFFYSGEVAAAPLGGWETRTWLADKLPKAKEYWAVVRFERQGIPKPAAISTLLGHIAEVQAQADHRHIPLTGIQLDIDAPTRALPEYAAFLRQFRRGLSPSLQLSITALLDWFRDGTSVADVIAEVDEFVPQFYDVAQAADPVSHVFEISLSKARSTRAIAVKFTAAEWAARLNRFGKRYRIGVATFGRGNLITTNGASVFSDLSPMNVGSNPAFTLQVGRNAAGEAILKYRAKHNVQISYNRILAGDIIEFVVPTPESVRAAYAEAQQFRGNCVGVLFFHWPESGQQVAMDPEEVLDLAGIAPHSPKEARIEAIDRECVAVDCVDLRLSNLNSHSPVSVHYTITSTIPIEYVLPEKDVAVRLSAPNAIDFVLPPFATVSSVSIGRLMTSAPSQLSITERK